jgi:hypothetical protein
VSNEHELLLDEWAASHPPDACFIRDGIIHQERWDKASVRILFLLRECYDYLKKGNSGFDLRTEIRQWDKAHGPTMQNAALWAYGIHNVRDNLIPSRASISIAQTFDSLLACAVVNIKKSRGVKASTLTDIDAFAVKDSQYICRQIELIAPHLVVCGGTWRSICRCPWVAGKYEPVYDHTVKLAGRYYLSHWHPSNRFPKALNYYTVVSLVQNSGCLTGITSAR